METSEPRSIRYRNLAAPAALFVLALGVRALPWPTVFAPDRVHFFGNDAWYHMRRVAWTLAHFPQVLGFDTYLNFPDGGKPIWSPLFDWAVATLALPAYALGGVHAAEVVAAWVPPLLGAGCVVLCFFLGQRHFDRASAWLAALVASVLSGHFWYSQIGFLDHHAAVAFASTGTVLLAMRLLVRPEDASRAPAAALGAALAGLLLLWPGALITTGVVVATLHAVALASERDAACADARRHAWLYALAFALVLPFALTERWPQWSAFSPTVLGGFQPWLFAALGLHALACARAWRQLAACASPTGRLAVSAALAASLLLLSGLALPGLLEGAGDAWRWLSKDEAFQGMVAESEPLFGVRGSFSTRVAEGRLSYFLYLAPLAWIALAVKTARSARTQARQPLWIFLAWSLVMGAATLLQKRFFNTFSVSLALLFGWSVVTAGRWLLARVHSGAGARRTAVAALAALVLFALWPSLRQYERPLRNQLQLMRGETLSASETTVRKRHLVRAAAWLREHSPPTSGFLDAGALPEYGVMSSWGRGHVLTYVAQRPTVVGNFGDDLGERNFRKHLAFYGSGEERAVRILEELGVRYAVSGPLRGTARERADPDSMLARLAAPSPTGLGRHRLVYQSPVPRAGDAPEVRIFELVAGARIIGAAKPGAAVGATLSTRVAGPARLHARWHTRADASGRWELRLPYASGKDPYLFSSDGATATFELSEESVLRGADVAGPVFAASDGG